MSEPTAPGQGGLPEVPAPELPELDAAMNRLEAASDRPLAEQVEAYEAVHRALQETLASIDPA